jgi:hypothetical protein
MNWTHMTYSAITAIALFSLFKYGFLYLSNRSYDRYQTAILRLTLEKHGNSIAERISIRVADRMIQVGEEMQNDHNESKVQQEARGAYNKES